MSENNQSNKNNKFSRRDLLIASGGVAAGVVVGANLKRKDKDSSLNASDLSSTVSQNTLIANIDELTDSAKRIEVWDYIIIGSGYGGSILAARLGEGLVGKKIAVLERGKEYAHKPGGANNLFPESLEDMTANYMRNPVNKQGLFELHPSTAMNVLVGSGVGGTSLINAAVYIEPKENVFKQNEWPNELNNKSVLSPYFIRVQEMLKVNRYDAVVGSNDRSKRYNNFKESVGGLLGASDDVKPETFSDLNLGINFNKGSTSCVQCGGCYAGCNVGAKNSLDKNYLPLAKENGVKIFSGIEVSKISKDNGIYKVHSSIISNLKSSEITIKAKNVIVSAGTMGTFKILSKSQNQAFKFSKMLGQNFSSNGDYVNAAFKVGKKTNLLGWPSQVTDKNKLPNIGPSIISVADYRKEAAVLSDDFIVVESAIPSAWMPGFVQKNREAFNALSNSLAYFAIGHEDKFGSLEYTNDKIKVNWEEGNQPNYINKMKQAMINLAAKMEGEIPDQVALSEILRNLNNKIKDYSIVKRVENFIAKLSSKLPIHLMLEDIIKASGNDHAKLVEFLEKLEEHLRIPLATVHPLGGCKLGNDVNHGVVNHFGQVFDQDGGFHKGLYICDGSVIPRSLGCHPILTISAIAEYIAENIVKNESNG